MQNSLHRIILLAAQDPDLPRAMGYTPATGWDPTAMNRAIEAMFKARGLKVTTKSAPRFEAVIRVEGDDPRLTPVMHEFNILYRDEVLRSRTVHRHYGDIQVPTDLLQLVKKFVREPKSEPKVGEVWEVIKAFTTPTGRHLGVGDKLIVSEVSKRLIVFGDDLGVLRKDYDTKLPAVARKIAGLTTP